MKRMRHTARYIDIGMKVAPSLAKEEVWLPELALRVPPPSESSRPEPTLGSSCDV